MAGLQAKLNAFKKDFEAKIPASALELMHRATDELRNSGIMDKTVKVGDKLPEFSLENQDGLVISSNELLSKGPLVISFFRGSWCPYCNLELSTLGESYEQFKQLGAEMVVISPQVREFALKAKNDNKLNCDVLVDQDNQYASVLGTAFKLPSYLKDLYQKFGVDMPKHNGDDSWTLPMPLRAVIDTDGIIQYLDINPDYTQRPEVEIALDTLKGLQ